MKTASYYPQLPTHGRSVNVCCTATSIMYDDELQQFHFPTCHSPHYILVYIFICVCFLLGIKEMEMFIYLNFSE